MDRHGIYISEAPTGIMPPVIVNTAIPVFFVTAPVHLTKNPYGVTNEPKLCYSYAEAASHFGMSTRKELWNKYTSCQVIYSQFALYGVAPAVIVNVLDPTIHRESVAVKAYNFEGLSLTIPVDGVLADTVKITNNEGIQFTEGIHYSLSFDNNGFVVVNAKKNIADGIAENAAVKLSYDVIAPDMVDEYDIIGGYDQNTGKSMGLEVMNEIYPRLNIIPGLIVAPKYSSNPSVAAIMETKAGNINGHFKCMAVTDIPTVVDGRRLLYTNVPAWKNENGYTSTRQINCYPKLKMDGLDFYYSVQMAGLIGLTDHENGGIPYVSPSFLGNSKAAL